MLMKRYNSFLRSLSGYTDTIGATILAFKNPIKIIVAIYIVMAILPFVAAFVFLMIQAIVYNHPDVDKFIKLGATIIGEPAISFVTFILGLCINGEKMLNKKISEDDSIMKSYMKRNNIIIQARPYNDQDDIGKK
jgi:hypothetical protein